MLETMKGVLSPGEARDTVWVKTDYECLEVKVWA